jgi:hypothetical protein
LNLSARHGKDQPRTLDRCIGSIIIEVDGEPPVLRSRNYDLEATAVRLA